MQSKAARKHNKFYPQMHAKIMRPDYHIQIQKSTNQNTGIRVFTHKFCSPSSGSSFITERPNIKLTMKIKALWPAYCKI